MPRPAKNPIAWTTAATSRGMEPENEPRPCHHQLAVHAQEGTPEVRLQQKQNHTVRDLVQCMVRRLTAMERLGDERRLRQCNRPLGREDLLAMMKYSAFLSWETARPWMAFPPAGFGSAALTVLSS